MITEEDNICGGCELHIKVEHEGYECSSTVRNKHSLPTDRQTAAAHVMSFMHSECTAAESAFNIYIYVYLYIYIHTYIRAVFD